jgi:hypothetical protein
MAPSLTALNHKDMRIQGAKGSRPAKEQAGKDSSYFKNESNPPKK